MCLGESWLTEAAKHGRLIDLELVALNAGWGSITLMAIPCSSRPDPRSQTPDPGCRWGRIRLGSDDPTTTEH